MRRVDAIKYKTSTYFEINPVHMVDHKRYRRFSRPRQIAMFLCRKHTDMSFTDIAAEFGKDHTTVVHAIRSMAVLIKKSPEWQENLTNIEATLPWLMI